MRLFLFEPHITAHPSPSRIDFCYLLHFSILEELFEACAISHTREGEDLQGFCGFAAELPAWFYR